MKTFIPEVSFPILQRKKFYSRGVKEKLNTLAVMASSSVYYHRVTPFRPIIFLLAVRASLNTGIKINSPESNVLMP